MPNYTKEELLAICERALQNLHPSRMDNRDCPDAFVQVAKFYAALKFCDIPFREIEDGKKNIVVEYAFTRFESFDSFQDEDKGRLFPESVYLPTPESLALAEKGDGTWY